MDLSLAIAHHLLAFALGALLFGEFLLMRREIGPAAVTTLARIDAFVGAFAAAILVVGLLRVFLGAKPESYYLQNLYFWAKMAAFVGVGLISIKPTRRFIAWRNSLRADAAFRPELGDALAVRRLLLAEMALFLFIPTFAAIMARYTV